MRDREPTQSLTTVHSFCHTLGMINCMRRHTMLLSVLVYGACGGALGMKLLARLQSKCVAWSHITLMDLSQKVKEMAATGLTEVYKFGTCVQREYRGSKAAVFYMHVRATLRGMLCSYLLSQPLHLTPVTGLQHCSVSA